MEASITWKGTESQGQIWLYEKRQEQNEKPNILLLRTAHSWERHFTAGRCGPVLQHPGLFPAQTCSSNTAVLPMEAGKSSWLPRCFTAVFSIPCASHSGTLKRFVSYKPKGNQVAFASACVY